VNTDVKSSSLISRQTGFIAGVALILIILIAGAWWLLRTTYEPLLSETNADSRAEMLAMLMQWQIPYKVDEATGLIAIPSDQVAQTRARLSGLGLPAAQTPGLEVFGQGDYGMSEFAQRINYQRGLEGELARTIRTFEEIKSARVHLTLAKSSLFENRKESAKASVAIQLKPNRSLSQQQISGIQQLVAGAITGLNPEQVIVLDELGKPLVTGESSEADRWSNVRQAERDYEERARHLIASMVPDSDINISVKLQFNFDRIKSVKETIIPAQSGNGYLVKKRDQVVSGQSPNSDNSTSTQNNNTTEVEYAYGKEHSEIEHASGVITRINIGVVINKPLSTDAVDTITAILRSGLGLSQDRGDSIAIVCAQRKASESASEKSLVNETTIADKNVEEKLPADSTPILSTASNHRILIGVLIGFFFLIVALLILRRPVTTA
jgi:flagellar M-ring protein FliF